MQIPRLTDKQRAEYIDKVGFELEGFWESGPAPNGFHEDGSVSSRLASSGDRLHTRECDFPDCEGECWDGSEENRDGWLGESTSHPLLMGADPWREWLGHNWPDNWDRSCGFHVHTSFKEPVAYVWLAEDEFYDRVFIPTMSDKAGAWGPLFSDRLQGGNQFCRRTFAPVAQVRANEMRYTQLNFCAIREHNTIECRLFPMFNDLHGAPTRDAAGRFVRTTKTHLEIAVEATETLLDVYVHYLRGCERARKRGVRVAKKRSTELIAATVIEVPEVPRKDRKPEVLLCAL